MKHSSKKSNNRNLFLKFDDDIIKLWNKKKLSGYAEDISLGIKNFSLFQKFCNFKWPAWLNNAYNTKDPSFHHITPYLLINNNYRDHVLIPNSIHYLRVDLTGMISPLDEFWSLEFWILTKNKLFRPQENTGLVTQTRDLKSGIIETKYEEKIFKFTEIIYNIESSEKKIKEDIIDLDLHLLKDNIPHSLFVVIRPYNLESIGNVKSIEYNKSRVIKINNHDRLYLENKPDYFYAGNGKIGDISFTGINNKPVNASCEFGMAALAFGYELKKGDNEYKIRINSAKERVYKPVKINYQKQKNEYIDNCCLKYQKGIKLTFPDNEFQDWFDGSRISALDHFGLGLSSIVNQNNICLKSVFYLTSGYNRMGLFSESKKIIDIAGNKIDTKNKPDFSTAINICYYIQSFTDYFKLSRDVDHLQRKYKHIREAAEAIYQYTSGIKKKKNRPETNSIDYYLIEEYHLFDMAILASALFEFSYLARCLGIFNDEIKYSKESQKLEEIFKNELDNSKNELFENDSIDDEHTKEESVADIEVPEQQNEHFAFTIFAGHPLSLKTISYDKLKEIADEISRLFPENPVFFKSTGAADTLFSVIFANNLLMLKNNRAHSLIEKLFEAGKQRFVLPDFLNPVTGHGTMGSGDSGTAISAFFMLLRAVIFMDSQDRLEIFPIPRKGWFSEGSEIKVENAPSVFGNLNFRCITTRNEVQLYFYDMPKFIPPEIMINLPFPVKIKLEDDFIIKKETASSVLIHGWPGIVRFKKK